MGHSIPTHDSQTNAHAASLAKTLAPEDVRAGDFVAILDEVCELPSYFWNDSGALAPRDQLVRIRCTPTGDAIPMRVKCVCLPFVLVKQPCGAKTTLDVRRTRLARLDPGFARIAWKAYKRAGAHESQQAIPPR